MRHFMLLFGGMLALQGCAPNWQPSWNTSGNAAIPQMDSLTVRRVTSGDTTEEVLRTETLDYGAMRALTTPATQMTLEDAMRLPPPAPPPWPTLFARVGAPPVPGNILPPPPPLCGAMAPNALPPAGLGGLPGEPGWPNPPPAPPAF